MTVSTAYAPLSYSGNGATTSFSVTWPFLTGSLVVTLISSTGVETVKTLTTHYTVSGGTDSNGLPATGTVTMLTAPASGQTLRIQRSTPRTQTLTWGENDAFPQKTIESGFDKLLLIAQEAGNAGSVNDEIGGDLIELVTSGAVDYWDAESHILRNVADATANTDAVNYGQLQQVIIDAGAGDVVGPASSTDNNVPRFDSTSGNRLQESTVFIDDSGNVTGVAALSATTVNIGSTGTTLSEGSSAGRLVVEGRKVAFERVICVSDPEFGAVVGEDATTAIANAYAALVALGSGVLYFGPGNWYCTSFPNIAANGVTIRGAGRMATYIQTSSATADLITITGNFCTVEDLSIQPTVRRTDGFAIRIAAGLNNSVRRVVIQYDWNGIAVVGAANIANCKLDNVSFGYLFGDYGIVTYATSPYGVFGVTLSDVSANNSPPQAIAVQSLKTWATSTAYTAGNVTITNGKLYQCTTSGTSAGAGTGPSGYGSGSTPDTAFSNAITDGTAAWKFVCKSSLTWLAVDSYAFSVRCLGDVALLHGMYGVRVTDTANTGSSAPRYIHLENLEVDHPIYEGVSLTRGSMCRGNNCWIGYSVAGDGIAVDSQFGGEIAFNNSHIVGHGKNGALIGAIATEGNVSFVNCSIDDNSQLSSGTYHGLNFSNSGVAFRVIGCDAGDSSTAGFTNYQGYGVYIGTGTSSFHVIGNDLRNNVTGGLSNNSTATAEQHVYGNAGVPDWTTYTPTVTAVSGTFTSVAATGRYQRKGKTVHVQMVITITTNGTAAGAISATLPFTAGQNVIMYGRETASSGIGVSGYAAATQGAIAITKTSDNTYPGADGYVLTVEGVMEIG